MEHIVYFILAFLLAYLGRYALYKKSKKTSKKVKKAKKQKDNMAIEMKYLVHKFELDPAKLDTKKIAQLISSIDAFIIAVTFTFVLLVTEDMILIFILGVLFIFVLIYGLYEILGRILLKKGYGKNGL